MAKTKIMTKGVCPPTFAPEWKDFVDALDGDETKATIAFFRNGNNIPTVERANELVSKPERGFVGTVRESKRTAPPVAETLAEGSPNSFYNPRSNQTDFAEAKRRVETDEPAVRAKIEQIIRGEAKPDSVDIIAGQILIDNAQRAGHWDEAIRLVESLATVGTEAGQAVQAFSIWNRLSPEGVLQFANRVIKRGTAADGIVRGLSPEKAAEIRAQAEKAQAMPEGRDKLLAQATLLRDIAELVPPSRPRQAATMLAMAQLLNFKTIARNIIGNTGFQVFENLAKPIAAAIDRATALATGKRSVSFTELQGLDAQGRAFVQGAADGYQEAIRGVDTTRMPTQFDLPQGRTFRGGPGRYGEIALNLALRVPDRAAFESAFSESILDQAWTEARNRGLKGKAAASFVDGLLKAPTSDMTELARYDGAYRTFADDNLLTGFFQAIKQTANIFGVGRRTRLFGPVTAGEFGLGNYLLNYPKVPANLINRMVAYSPIGFAKTLWNLGKMAQGAYRGTGSGQANQREFAQSAGRAIVGSVGITALGAILASLGLISLPSEDEDKNIAAIRRREGLGKYRINATGLWRYASGLFKDVNDAAPNRGDTWVSYDWSQPLAGSLAMGSRFYDTANKQEIQNGRIVNLDEGSFYNQLSRAADWEGVDTILSASETVAEQPMIAGLRRALQSYGTDDASGLAGIFGRIIENAPASNIPTLLYQFQQATDNIDRERWSQTTLERTINNVMIKIPFWARGLPPRTYQGKPAERYVAGSNTIFNVFFNPAFVSQYVGTPEGELILDVWKQTGDRQAVPSNIPRTIRYKGNQIVLNEEQWLKINQEIQQNISSQLVTIGERWRNTSPTNRNAVDYARQMKKIIDTAEETAKNNLIVSLGVTPQNVKPLTPQQVQSRIRTQMNPAAKQMAEIRRQIMGQR